MDDDVAAEPVGQARPDTLLPAPPPRSRNLRTLDLLRGLAAMAVVIFHVGQRTSLVGFAIPGAAAGEVGVQMFFVLSGFLIATSVLAPHSSPPGTTAGSGRFASSRCTTWPSWPSSSATPCSASRGRASPTSASHVVLLQGLFPHYQTAISGVLWTLTIEWLFYGLMLLLAFRFRRPGEGWLIAGAMLVVGVAWRTWISIAYRGHAFELEFLDKQLIGAADVFACGMIVALLVHEGRGQSGGATEVEPASGWRSRWSASSSGSSSSMPMPAPLLVLAADDHRLAARVRPRVRPLRPVHPALRVTVEGSARMDGPGLPGTDQLRRLSAASAGRQCGVPGLRRTPSAAARHGS